MRDIKETITEAISTAIQTLGIDTGNLQWIE